MKSPSAFLRELRPDEVDLFAITLPELLSIILVQVFLVVCLVSRK
jgi:hypothetical protein